MKSSEDDKGRGVTGAITESLITFPVFLRISLTIAIDKFTLYSTRSNRLTGSISTLIFWPGNVEGTNFDNLLTCEIGGEMTDFLHDSVLWDGNI